MYPILVGGYRPQYDEQKLRNFLETSSSIAPMAKSAAFDLLDGKTIREMMVKYGHGRGYTHSLRARAKMVLNLILAVNPERFGLEKIEPATEGMTTKELAEHCGVSKPIIRSMVLRREKSGLPAPEERNRGWWFPAETANLYIQNLGG